LHTNKNKEEDQHKNTRLTLNEGSNCELAIMSCVVSCAIIKKIDGVVFFATTKIKQ
jgi:hypothetical protein